MATITGLTAERMVQIEASSIVAAQLVDDHLILYQHDGTPIDVGSVRGDPGPQGPPGSVNNHTHPIEDIVDLATALSGKADDEHGHDAGDITSGLLDVARLALASDSEAKAGSSNDKLLTPGGLGSSCEVSGTIAMKTYYEKYADGRLICAGMNNFPANAGTTQTYAWTFPIEFVGRLPHVTATVDATVPTVAAASLDTLTLSAVNIKAVRSSAFITPVYFQAEGRWK